MPRHAPSGPRHRFVPHTAETILRIEGGTPPHVWAEACRAMGRAFVAEAGSLGPGAARDLVVESVDVDAVLVDLLNELIYLAESERWAPRAAEVVEWEGPRVVLTLTGDALARAPARIKSATHHGAGLVRTATGVRAEVILDV